MSSSAFNDIHTRKYNNATILPQGQDLKKLSELLVEGIKEAME